jgi:hypothetical protein
MQDLPFFGGHEVTLVESAMISESPRSERGLKARLELNLDVGGGNGHPYIRITTLQELWMIVLMLLVISAWFRLTGTFGVSIMMSCPTVVDDAEIKI